jgi:protein phosphatase
VDRVLVVGGLGNSRCVLSRDGKAVQLTVEHFVCLSGETEHILEERKINDGVPISDECVGVMPEVQQIELEEHDEFLIMASNGVWSVMDNQVAVDLIKDCSDPTLAARKIRDCAFERDSVENLSIIVVFLKRRADVDDDGDL